MKTIIPKAGDDYETTHIDNTTNEDYNDNVELSTLLDKLRPFQREGFDFATQGLKENNGGGRILLADEMGLGKTVTSLAVMLAYKHEWPLLILCPASLRYTWPAEIEKFYPSLPHSAVYVVKGFDDCDFYSNPTKRSRIQIVIATYSLLQNRSAASRVLQQFKFKCIIADESHNLKERTSQRCKLALPLLQNANRALLLTGTPALARPVELWAQLHCLDADLFGSYTHYTTRYCNAKRGRFGWDVSGLSNADELHRKLKTIMVRRLKVNVLKELPPKQRSVVPVKIQNSKHIKECTEIVSQLKQKRKSIQSLDGEEAKSAELEARNLYMRAYGASGRGKAEGVANYVLDWLKGSGTQKLLVFAHHTAVLDTIEAAVSKHFKGISHIRIDGKVSPKERADRVKKFQNKPRVRVGLLSVTAAGVGLTLTAASTVIFAELHWTPGVLAQAEDRTHRIGQVNSVNIIYCVCKEKELSVDLSLWSMLGKKVNNLGRMIDGERGASMNASNVENSASDDVASFFADNDPTDDHQSKRIIPVKGSIQSFFVPKAKDGAELESSSVKLSSSSSSSSQPKRRIISTPDDMRKATPSKPLVVSPMTIVTIPSPSVAQLHPWPCHLCTFVNENRSRGCEMCGTRRKESSVINKVIHSSNNYQSSSQSSSSPINIVDLSDDNCQKRIKSNPNSYISNKNDLSSVVQVIDLCDIDVNDNTPSVVPEALSTDHEECFIQFSVSQNSGRIAIHDIDGKSLSINFDIDEVITEFTTDKIMEKQLKRTLSQRKSSIIPDDVKFHEHGVKKVAEKIIKIRTKSHFTSIDSNQRQLQLKICNEIKSFVKSYILLREVEKKAIKEHDEPVNHDGLHETLKEIMFASSASTLTSTSSSHLELQRYAGGAKERAVENLAIDELSDVDKRVLEGMACCWCGGDLPQTSLEKGVKSTYCSQDCAEEGRLKRGGMYASSRVREQLFCLERGECQKCGIDANALFLRINALQPAERLNALCNVNWYLPKASQSLNRLLQHPREADFWQADHIVPVAEGGGSCGLENLRTLCTPCHQNETEKLRHRLRLNDSSKMSPNRSSRSSNVISNDNNSSSSTSKADDSKIKNSMDLRAFFASPKSKVTAKKTVAKKRKRSAD